jgi:signal transduction histidine kinase
MGPIAIQKDVKVYLDAPEELIFKADREEFEIIFNNLISNAIKYNIEGGRVDCALEEKPEKA